MNETTTKKKGRPSKAEQERRAREQAARVKLAAEVAEIKRKADEYNAAVDAAHKATKAARAEQRASNAAALAEYHTALKHYHAPNPDILPMPNETAINGLYDLAETVVYIVIRSRQAKTPSKLWDELQSAFVTDAAARSGLVTLAELDSTRAAARYEQHKHEQAAKRIHMTDEDRAAEILAAQSAKRTADNAKDTADDIRNDKKAVTLSSRNTLTHAVIVQWYTNIKQAAPITAGRLARYGLESMDELDELDEETRAAIQAAANFAAMCAAAQRAIRELSHPDACRKSWTKAKRATAEQVADWMAKYGAATKDESGEVIKVDADVKVQTKGGYDTLEYRAATKTKAAGWYIVHHGRTIALEEHIDEPTEDDEGNKNGKDIEDTTTAAVDARDELLNLAAIADLTDRERYIIHAFASDAAQDKGQAAADERKRKDGRRWSNRANNAARYAAQTAHAKAATMAAYGISAKTAANIWSMAVAALDAAAPKFENPHYDFAAEMRKQGHIGQPIETDRPDIIAAVSQYAAEHGHRPDYYGQDAVIYWQTAEQAEQAKADHKARAAEQAAESNGHNWTEPSKAAADAAAVAYELKAAAPTQWPYLSTLSHGAQRHALDGLKRSRRHIAERVAKANRATKEMNAPSNTAALAAWVRMMHTEQEFEKWQKVYRGI